MFHTKPLLNQKLKTLTCMSAGSKCRHQASSVFYITHSDLHFSSKQKVSHRTFSNVLKSERVALTLSKEISAILREDLQNLQTLT